MSAADRGTCPTCGAPLSRENSSKLRSGQVIHVGCPGKAEQGVQAERKPRRRLSFGEPKAEAPQATAAKKVGDEPDVIVAEDPQFGALVRAVWKVLPGTLLYRTSGGTAVRFIRSSAPDVSDEVYDATRASVEKLFSKFSTETLQIAAEKGGPDAIRQLFGEEAEKKAPPIHMLVPGFPGHACCAHPLDEEKPKPGKKPAKVATTERAEVTCADCLETYDSAEALDSRIEELRPPPTEAEEEAEWEEMQRARRSEEQLVMLGTVRDPKPVSDDAQLHVILVSHGEASIATLCGAEVKLPWSEIEETIANEKHPRFCPGCVGVKGDDYRRKYGAFLRPSDLRRRKETA